jgi:hypothetical protein
MGGAVRSPEGVRVMRAPDRYSVSPLHSFCTVPVHRTPSFAETVKAVWRWVTGHHALPLRERIIEQRVVERLAEEIEEEGTSGRYVRRTAPRFDCVCCRWDRARREMARISTDRRSQTARDDRKPSGGVPERLEPRSQPVTVSGASGAGSSSRIASRRRSTGCATASPPA